MFRCSSLQAQLEASSKSTEEIIEIQRLTESVRQLESSNQEYEQKICQVNINNEKLISENQTIKELLHDYEDKYQKLALKEKTDASLHDEITGLKKELEKKSANVSECLRLKNVRFFFYF